PPLRNSLHAAKAELCPGLVPPSGDGSASPPASQVWQEKTTDPEATTNNKVTAGSRAGRVSLLTFRHDPFFLGGIVHASAPIRIYLDRTARRHRHYRDPHWPPCPGRAEGARGRRAHPVQQQPAPDRHRPAQLPRCLQGVPHGQGAELRCRETRRRRLCALV